MIDDIAIQELAEGQINDAYAKGYLDGIADTILTIIDNLKAQGITKEEAKGRIDTYLGIVYKED